MATKITYHGNSLSLRIPAHIARAMKLHAGDYVAVRLMDDGDIRIRPLGGFIADADEAISQTAQKTKRTRLTDKESLEQW